MHQTDNFVRDNLPPASQWPDLIFELPELQYPEHLNCTVELLDHPVHDGHGDRPAVIQGDIRWSYRELSQIVSRLAWLLVEDLELVPGNRVLLRGPNTPILAALWLAVVRAGGVVVTTMSMLREPELCKIIEKAQPDAAFCDVRFKNELEHAVGKCGQPGTLLTFGDGELERLIAGKADTFEPVRTRSDDPCLIGFTSGTTGNPKAAVQFHRDILAAGDTVSRHILQPVPEDIFLSTAPLAFTFGLGMELLFPLRAGAATVFLEDLSPESVAGEVERSRVTFLSTAPAGFRSLLGAVADFDLSSLRNCVSAGETLPAATSDAWFGQTGMRIIDGLGSTEMLHIFISARGDDIIAGSTGREVPGYRACLLDDDGQAVFGPGVGRLAVKGPTGCRYLDDARQAEYVVDGWNVTGDVYERGENGYFWFKSRADDMILSAGYNIAGPEVEAALLKHRAVQECAVVGTPDPDRGHVVTAYVVRRDSAQADPNLTRELQDFVKQSIAPYKYPRKIEFVDSLPKTETGKIQRFKLRRPGP